MRHRGAATAVRSEHPGGSRPGGRASVAHFARVDRRGHVARPLHLPGDADRRALGARMGSGRRHLLCPLGRPRRARAVAVLQTGDRSLAGSLDGRRRAVRGRDLSERWAGTSVSGRLGRPGGLRARRARHLLLGLGGRRSQRDRAIRGGAASRRKRGAAVPAPAALHPRRASEAGRARQPGFREPERDAGSAVPRRRAGERAHDRRTGGRLRRSEPVAHPRLAARGRRAAGIRLSGRSGVGEAALAAGVSYERADRSPGARSGPVPDPRAAIRHGRRHEPAALSRLAGRRHRRVGARRPRASADPCRGEDPADRFRGSRDPARELRRDRPGAAPRRRPAGIGRCLGRQLRSAARAHSVSRLRGRRPADRHRRPAGRGAAVAARGPVGGRDRGPGDRGGAPCARGPLLPRVVPSRWGSGDLGRNSRRR